MGAYRAKQGRWGEACVMRAMRDRGWIVLTQPEELFMPGFDLLLARKGGGSPDFELWLQVKATGKNYKEGYNIHYGALMKIANAALHNNSINKWGIAVVSLSKQLIFMFSYRYVMDVLRDKEAARGDGPTPGMCILEWDNASASFALTSQEVREGIGLWKDEAPNQYQNDLF